MPAHRSETRAERYNSKTKNARKFPFSVATVNFMNEDNLSFVVRSSACFGGQGVHVIGKMPDPVDLKKRSCGLSKFTQFYNHKNPYEFLNWCRKNDYYIVSAELTQGAVNFNYYDFPLDKQVMIVLGHEETGVPTDILNASNDIVFIPMPGSGFCLNTSQTGNIMIAEYVKQASAVTFNY